MSDRSRAASGRRIGRIGLVLALSAVGVTVASVGSSAARISPQKSVADTFVPIIAGGSNTGTPFLPMYVGQAKGWFAKAGINFTADTFSGGDPTTMAAFSNNETNMLEGGVSDAVEYILNGVIPANGGKFIDELAGNSYDIDTVKSITSLQGIEGHIVGVGGIPDGSYIYFAAVLKAYGIPASSVTYVVSGSTAARLTSLETGATQATAESDASRSTVETFGNVVLTAQKSKVQMPTTSMFASSALLKHTKEMQAFVNVLDKATKWIRTNQIAATAICQTYTSATEATCSTGIQATVSGAAKGAYTWSNTGAVSVSGVEQAIKVVKSLFPQYTLKLNASKIVDFQFTGQTP